MEVALIGYGYWGKILRRYIDKSNIFTIKKIYRRNGTAGEVFTNDLGDILGNKNIKAVFIATPISVHLEQILLFLCHKKYVFCEKPLCRSDQNYYDLQRCLTVNNSDLIVYTDYIYLVSKSILKLKNISSNIGLLKHIYLSMQQYGNFYAENVYEVLGAHCISILVYLLDIDDVENLEIRRFDGFVDEKAIVQSGMLFLKWKSVSCTINLNLVNEKKERIVDIIGEKGCIHFDMFAQKQVTVFNYKSFKDILSKHVVDSYTMDESNNLELVIKDFYESILRHSLNNFTLACKVQEILKKGMKNGIR